MRTPAAIIATLFVASLLAVFLLPYCPPGLDEEVRGLSAIDHQQRHGEDAANHAGDGLCISVADLGWDWLAAKTNTVAPKAKASAAILPEFGNDPGRTAMLARRVHWAPRPPPQYGGVLAHTGRLLI